MKIFIFLILFGLLVGCTQTGAPTTKTTEQTLPDAPLEPASNQSESSDDSTEPKEVVTEETLPNEVTEPEEDHVSEQSSLNSEEIMFKSSGWEIYGTLYTSKTDKYNPEKAVILVPMLGQTRDSYPQSFVESIHNNIPDAVIITLDPRGQGKSTNFGNWDQFGLTEFKGMASDIAEARQYLKTRYPTIDNVYVVGASMGSSAGILATKLDSDIVKLAMISPGMEYRDVKISTSVDDYIHPLFLATARADYYSASAVSEIEAESSSKTTVKIYEGSNHGTDLFEGTTLESDLIEFLK
ncbi:alpha/beta hydrolase [Candidatus Micrarchaeota archaeon]|nr:alpha/beta hydrolase [Candidatus Micrarchaeota archaeon]MBU1681489.1 alpha/beta hydrolase [Candidatus Micrarchaeota archaeon]